MERITDNESLKKLGKVNILGTNIHIPSNSVYIHNKPGFTIEYKVDSIEILIGIGTDHTAKLTMSLDTLDALDRINSESVKIVTI